MCTAERANAHTGECETLLCGTSNGLTRYFSRGSVSNASPNIDRQYSAILACCFGLRKDKNNIGVFPCWQFMSQQPAYREQKLPGNPAYQLVYLMHAQSMDAAWHQSCGIYTHDLKWLTSPRGSRRKGWQETARSWRHTLQWPQSPPKRQKELP